MKAEELVAHTEIDEFGNITSIEIDRVSARSPRDLIPQGPLFKHLTPQAEGRDLFAITLKPCEERFENSED